MLKNWAYFKLIASMRKPKACYVNVKNVKNKNFGYPGLSSNLYCTKLQKPEK